MPHIKIDKAVIHLTEKTIKELLAATVKAKRKNKRRVRVESDYSNIAFEIMNDMELNPQESLGYKRVLVKEEPKTSIKVQRQLSKKEVSPDWYELE